MKFSINTYFYKFRSDYLLRIWRDNIPPPPRPLPAILGSAAGRAQVSEGRREGVGRKHEEREKMAGGRRASVGGRGKKTDT